MLFAVCGGDERMVIKKKYKPGDLATKETQVCEIDLDEDIDLPSKNTRSKAKTRVKSKAKSTPL
jgi:hypothetical protein